MIEITFQILGNDFFSTGGRILYLDNFLTILGVFLVYSLIQALSETTASAPDSAQASFAPRLF